MVKSFQNLEILTRDGSTRPSDLCVVKASISDGSQGLVKKCYVSGSSVTSVGTSFNAWNASGDTQTTGTICMLGEDYNKRPFFYKKSGGGGSAAWHPNITISGAVSSSTWTYSGYYSVTSTAVTTGDYMEFETTITDGMGNDVNEFQIQFRNGSSVTATLEKSTDPYSGAYLFRFSGQCAAFTFNNFRYGIKGYGSGHPGIDLLIINSIFQYATADNSTWLEGFGSGDWS